MIIDPQGIDTTQVYKLLTGAVVPRPVAWVSSLGNDGSLNLAPYSFFNVASRQPPMLSISIGPRTGGEAYPKDTLTNIRQSREFVINMVSMSLANAMHETSFNHPPGVNEFGLAGVTPARCEVVNVPRVVESLISMECTLEHELELGSDVMIIGRLHRYHVRDDIIENGRIDQKKLDPVARMAGNYAKLGELFDLPMK